MHQLLKHFSSQGHYKDPINLWHATAIFSYCFGMPRNTAFIKEKTDSQRWDLCVGKENRRSKTDVTQSVISLPVWQAKVF